MSKEPIRFDSSWLEININNYHNSRLEKARQDTERQSKLRDLRATCSFTAPFWLPGLTGGHPLAIATGVGILFLDGVNYLRTYHKSDQTLELLETAQRDICRYMPIPQKSTPNLPTQLNAWTRRRISGKKIIPASVAALIGTLSK